jgi:RNA polymerase sigma-70 factor (ECF subfamily)
MLKDKWLASRCRRGDREAFSIIYEAYVDDLLTLAIHLLGDVATAEDVVQDVFVNFARTARSFHLTGSLKGYLATCTANRARDVIRHRKRSQPARLPDDDALDSGVPGPFASVAEKEQQLQLRLALAKLPREQREAVVLRLHGDLTFKEIAALEGVSLKTVQSRYRYALEKLRTLLKNEVAHEAQR